MSRRLFEPDDLVSLRVVRAERVLPDDIYWGVERPGDEGFALLREGVPVPLGAIPDPDARRLVRIGEISVDPLRLVLIQDLR
jgi:hypothetical protein